MITGHEFTYHKNCYFHLYNPQLKIESTVRYATLGACHAPIASDVSIQD